MAHAEWPPYVDRVFRCSCGTEIGVSEHTAKSLEDGRDLGPSYLELAPNSLSGALRLWRIGTGDAGYFDQRCPGCDAQLVQPPAQDALF